MSVFSGSGNLLHRKTFFGDRGDGPNEWDDLATVEVE